MNQSDRISKEIARYLLGGFSTTAINLSVYIALLELGLIYTTANLIALLTSKTCAYLINKRFVYCTRCNSLKELFHEMFRYIVSRGITAAIDHFGLIVAVSMFKQDEVCSKLILQFIVIVLNYILGKTVVFKKNQ